MIEKLFLLILIFPLTLFAQGQTPVNDDGTGSEYNARLFYGLEKHQLDGSVMLQWENFDSPNREKEEKLSLGWRSGLHDWWKWGVHLERTTGLRTSDDWVVNRSSWAWSWREKKESKTYTLNPEWIARHAPTWNWGQAWVLEWRLEYYYNLHASDTPHRKEHGLKARPGIFHTWSNSKGPLITGTLSYEFDFSNGENEKKLKEQSLYVGALVHLSKHFLFGPFVGTWKGTWAKSQDAIDLNIGAYEAEEKLTIVGMNLNLYF